MSVLSFPRIILNGTTSWNPTTQNNALSFGYDKDLVKVELPEHVTYDTYTRWLIELNQRGTTNGDWDVFGQMHATFDATVNNLLSGPYATPSDDALMGARLRFTGGVPKLVDVNPYSPFTSQVFSRTIGIESQSGAGFSGPAMARMTSRTPFMGRNLGGLKIAGNMGVIWQTVMVKDKITWQSGDAASPTLEVLRRAMDDPGVLGLMLRISSYTTIYFSEIVDGGWIGQDARDVYGPLAQKYEAAWPVNPGNIPSTFNPAVSGLAGAIGLWQDGDLMTVPDGRVMAAKAPVAGAVTLGAAAAEVRTADSVVSFDLMNTIPETGTDKAKADCGTLEVIANLADGTTRSIGAIPKDRYDKAAYDAGGGIVDVAYSGISAEELAGATLTLKSDSNKCTPLNEELLAALVDMRSVYIDQGNAGSFDIQVISSQPLPVGAKLAATVLESEDGVTTIRLTGGSAIYAVGADGKVTVSFDSQDTGNCLVLVQAFVRSALPPLPLNGPTPAMGYAAVRVMPTDAEINNVPDDQVTWEYVYDNVLRPFDLVYRGMSCGVFSLGSEAAVKANAKAIAGLTDPEMFESPLYMPVTRDLSTGRRKLLLRFLGIGDEAPPTS